MPRLEDILPFGERRVSSPVLLLKTTKPAMLHRAAVISRVNQAPAFFSKALLFAKLHNTD